VVTLHGELALRFAAQSLTATFPPEGILDHHLDPTLEGIAPAAYYRATYQAKEYSLRELGRHFEILAYLENATNWQDLAVLRKR
jgi:hypothetical protein